MIMSATGIPRKGGRRYFYTYNSGLQNQSALFVREGLTGKGRLLLDPATLSADGSCALAQWEPSADGRYLLYAIQQDGSDARTLRVLDADSGQTLPDRIDRARYSSLAWRQDGKGFFYAGFVAVAGAKESPAALGDHRVWYHALGTAEAADQLVFSTPGKVSLRHVPRVTDDGRWLLILSSDGAGDPQEVAILSLAQRRSQTAPPRARYRPVVALCRRRGRPAVLPDRRRRAQWPHRHIRRDQAGSTAGRAGRPAVPANWPARRWSAIA